MNDAALSSKDSQLSGYDFVIVGASGGIGQFLVKTYKNENRVFGTYFKHDPSGLVEGPQYLKVDIRDTKSVDEFVDRIGDQLRKPVVIYTSGISPNNLVHKLTDDDLNNTIATNLTGAILVTRKILPVMRKLGFGRFIFLSSVLSRMAVQGTAVYSATKAGLNAFSKVVALENAKTGITSNSIALGYFEIGIISAVPPDYLRNKVIPNIPQGRLGSPIEIVRTIDFIIDNSYLTGSTIDLNGGIISG